MQEMNYDLGTTISLKDRVYSALKKDIILGRLKPGTPINSLEICSKMNISSAPLREALNMLNRDGLVTFNPRKHASVSEINADEVETTMYLRLLLEPYAAHLSVMKIPQAEIDKERVMLRRVLEEEPLNIESYVESDIRLHEILYRYSGSKLLSEVLTQVKECSIRLRYCAEIFGNSDYKTQKLIAEVATQEHIAILDAIDRRDVDLVDVLVREHLQKGNERNLPSYFQIRTKSTETD